MKSKIVILTGTRVSAELEYQLYIDDSLYSKIPYTKETEAIDENANNESEVLELYG